jgi:hypothetical protein
MDENILHNSFTTWNEFTWNFIFEVGLQYDSLYVSSAYRVTR